MKKLSIVFAERCAWRAVYVYYGESQVGHLGIDPTYGPGPSIFGALYVISGRGFRLRLPVVRFKYQMSPVRKALYRAQQRVLHGLDGRYGWGTGR